MTKAAVKLFQADSFRPFPSIFQSLESRSVVGVAVTALQGGFRLQTRCHVSDDTSNSNSVTGRSSQMNLLKGSNKFVCSSWRGRIKDEGRYVHSARRRRRTSDLTTLVVQSFLLCVQVATC